MNGHFGGQSNRQASFVLAKTLYHYDVLNELIVLPQIKPYRYGELTTAYDAIEQTQDDMLMIYDRNFCNYKMAALHLWQEREKKFVIGAKETQNMIAAFIKNGQASCVTYIKPTPSAIESLKKNGFVAGPNTLLKVRLVRVELPQSTEVLITNLGKRKAIPLSSLKTYTLCAGELKLTFQYKKTFCSWNLSVALQLFPSYRIFMQP